jgi:hypothetical protein
MPLDTLSFCILVRCLFKLSAGGCSDARYPNTPNTERKPRRCSETYPMPSVSLMVYFVNVKIQWLAARPYIGIEFSRTAKPPVTTLEGPPGWALETEVRNSVISAGKYRTRASLFVIATHHINLVLTSHRVCLCACVLYSQNSQIAVASRPETCAFHRSN